MKLVSYLYWLTDEQIDAAIPFEQWNPHYTNNPAWSHTDPATNAYHVKYLAEKMLEFREWMGPPAIVTHHHNHKLTDGNHRVRAVQYLENKYGIRIHVPIEERE